MSSASSSSSSAIPAGWDTAVKVAATLSTSFGSAAVIADAAGVFAKSDTSSSSSSSVAVSIVAPSSSLETALGFHLLQISDSNRLADKVTTILSNGTKQLAPQTAQALGAWLEGRGDTTACTKALEYLDVWLARDGAFDAEIKDLYETRKSFSKKSRWIVVGDGWGQGTDVTGIHHVLSSGEDVNVLVLASDPTSEALGGGTLTTTRRDIGLYALNYGNSYVASTSPSSHPDQFKNALAEADAFHGPSVVLAYIPTIAVATDSAATTTPAATPSIIVSGNWPLYRYDPTKDAQGVSGFVIDSEKLRDDLAAFVDRESHLALLSRTEPVLPAALTSSLEAEASKLAVEAELKLKASFDKLMGALTLPPLTVLFGSDGGNAENIAKRLVAEARTRGFKDIMLKAMDLFPLEQLATTPLVTFVVSTAGQGEFPMNARHFWKSLAAATRPSHVSSASSSDGSAAGGAGATDSSHLSTTSSLDLSNTHFAVFGMGDSNYWPRKEQRIFFNKASNDLDAQLAALGAHRIVERGVGDDQETGGYQAGYKNWVPSLWTALGVGSVDGARASENARVRGNEDIKRTSNFLRGTILQGLADTSTGALTYEDTQLTKFHGIYQQDDRDIRGERKKRGLEPAYSFMVRVRIPGGVCTPQQYLALDRIADVYANGTIRATTRQAVQFHGIIKGVLKPSIAAMNRALMDTLAACGDVNRNVMCTANPEEGELHGEVLDFTRRLSAHLSPRTSAYHEIWLDEKLVGGGSVDIEPIYGKEYLPRKFKIGVAVPPNNDVDIYTQDMSFVAVADPTTGKLAGFTVLIGGGMGMTHNNTKTYPRLAEVLCYVPLDKAIAVGEAVVTTQRDYGDRTNRKHARLKYTVDDKGIDWFRTEVGNRVGFVLEPPRPFTFSNNADRYGWTQLVDKTWAYTLFIQNGRIKDTDSYRLKSGLKAISNVLRGEMRFTGNQNLMIAKIAEGDKAQIASLLAEYGIENSNYSGLRLNAMACVAMPTCGLALAESERYLPSLISLLDVAIDEAGLHSEAITLRMTGCPNGCARPFVAEIGFVGRSPGIYNVYLGAGHSGERLNKLFKEGLDEAAIVSELSPLFKRFAIEKTAGEHFGDWVIRAGIVKATISGRTFHEI